MKKYFSLYLFVFMVLSASGQNVGIGTSTPTEKLQVAGNILTDTVKLNAMLLTPNAGAGKILTSDDIGNASWQENNIPVSENIGYGVWGDCATNGNITAYQPMADTAAQEGDGFGRSVSLSGNYAVVGSYGDDESFSDQGSATFYHFNGSKWELIEKIIDPDGEVNEWFGVSVGISNTYGIVGAQYDSEVFSQQGSASIYQYNGSNWELMQKITDPGGGTFDEFGVAVTISEDYALVGAPYDTEDFSHQGSASIYQYNGSNWELMEKLTNPGGEANENFGSAVSISGYYAIIGAPYDAGIYSNQGSASIFQFNGSNWVLMDKLVDATGDNDDNFGSSVSISGEYAVVGAPNDDINLSNQGSISLFHFDGSHWILQQKIANGSGVNGENFGSSVVLCGQFVMAGAEFDNVGSNTQQGSTTLFQRIGSCWQKLQLITDPSGNGVDFFGGSCSMDCATGRFLIGERGFLNACGKIVFGKIN